MIKINPAHEGLFRKETHTPAGKPVSAGAIMSKLKSPDAAVRKRANFARMAKRHFKPL